MTQSVPVTRTERAMAKAWTGLDTYTVKAPMEPVDAQEDAAYPEATAEHLFGSELAPLREEQNAELPPPTMTKPAKKETEEEGIARVQRQLKAEAEQRRKERDLYWARKDALKRAQEVITVRVHLAENGQKLSITTLRRGSTVRELRELVTAQAPVAMPALRLHYKGRRLESHETLVDCEILDGGRLEAEPVQALVTASADCTAKIWDPAAGEVLITLEGHEDAVYTAAYAPNCDLIVTTSEDCTAKVWSIDNGKCLMTLKGHRGTVYDAQFSPDCLAIVTASEDCTAKVWILKLKGDCPVTLRGHTVPVCLATFEPDGHGGYCVATVDRGGTKKLWDPETGVCHRTLSGHKHVYSATFAADGKSFVTASGNRNPGTFFVEISDVETGDCIQLLKGHSDLVFAASYAPALLCERQGKS